MREIVELFGYETRNKYQILDEQKRLIAYAAEQGKGLIGFILRQYLGHWRKFDVHFMSPERDTVLVAHHPFRFFFQRIEVRDGAGRLFGAIQRRFSFFTKRFDVEDTTGRILLKVDSPFFRFWTFDFMRNGRQVASIQKKWSGLFNEAFTDKDIFMIEFNDSALPQTERTLILAASIFVDMLYFEQKAR